MMRLLKPMAAAGMLLALSATAAEAATKSPRACFWVRDVNGWSAADDHTVYLRVGVKEVWRLDLLGTCPDIKWDWRIALSSTGSSTVCSPLDATIIAHTPIGPQRCPVKQVTRLTPQEVAALPPKQRP